MDDFEVLLSECYPALDRYVKFRVGSSDAEDLVQEICLTAYQRFEQLREQDAFKGWILSIARNKCNDYFRKSARFETVPLELVPELQLVCGRRGLTVQSVVEDTIGRLPVQDREILKLFFWQELSQQEIAKRLSIPLGTVKSRLYHAKLRFKSSYPYPPRIRKGVNTMGKLPGIMPEYTIAPLEKPSFACRWEELQGWLIVPRLGEKLNWAMYDFPEKTRTSRTEMEVVGRAEVHGVEGVEIAAVQYGNGDDRDPGFSDGMPWRFVAQLTDTHCRYLAASHFENGIHKYHTFLDGDEFFVNWGYGENNCGSEVMLESKGLLSRAGNTITAPEGKETLDVVGRYAVTIGGKTYDTVCVMDVELYNEAVLSEQFVDRNGRTILWRRFNRDDWAIDRFGGKKWSEKFPDNERMTVNGEVYVHWYDCISDYIL